jgi:hypothetical protein
MLNVMQRGVVAIVVAVLVLFGAACAGSKAGPTVGNQPGQRAAVTAADVVGNWREHWGIPGQTDVTYHDKYRVSLDGGALSVRPSGEGQQESIEAARLDGDTLHVVIRTAFEVRYELRLEPDGNTLLGTATTPDKVVPIRWERIGD